MLLTPFGSLLNLTLLNSVGNQKALVGKICSFATNAFWFPTKFDIVKFSREPKGFGREKAQRAKRKENEASKSKFWKRKNCKIKRGNDNFGPNPGQMAFLEDSVGNQKALVGKICLFATNAFWSPTEFDIVKFSREPKGFSRENMLICY